MVTDARWVAWDDFYVAPDPATGFDGAVGGRAPGAQRQFVAFAKSYWGLSASLGGSYAVGDRLVLRANIARGYRAPNIPKIGSNGLDPGAHIVSLGNRAFRPKFSLQKDVGVLWKSSDWEASAEAFYNRVHNFIYRAKQYNAQGQPLALVPGNATYQFEQAAAHLYGGELAANLHPAALPWLSWRTGAALVIGLNDNPTLRDRVGEAGRYLPLIPAPQARTELRFTAPERRGRAFMASYLRLTVDATARQTHCYAADDAEIPRPATCSAAWARALPCAPALATRWRSSCCKPTTSSMGLTRPTLAASNTSSTTPLRPAAGWASTAPAAT